VVVTIGNKDRMVSLKLDTVEPIDVPALYLYVFWISFRDINVAISLLEVK